MIGWFAGNDAHGCAELLDQGCVVGGQAAMALCLAWALVEVLALTFYLSVAQEVPLWRHFVEMAALIMGVALISFLIGLLVRQAFGVNI